MNKINRSNKDPIEYVNEPELEPEEGDGIEPDTIAESQIDWNYSDIDTEDIEGITNILLIGQDKRSTQDERTRSDSMIVCSINADTSEISLTSLMRDMYVPIPGYSDNRLNAAYAYGGMGLLDETLKQDFDITIDGNIEVDLEGFIKTMASIGTIKVELNEEEAEYMNMHANLGSSDDKKRDDQNRTAGMNELDENDALLYVRMRHVGNSDYERTERQRKLIFATFENLKNLSPIEMYKTLDDVFPNLTTDMTNREILKYIVAIMKGDMKIVGDYRLPVDGTYTAQTIRGMAVLVPDLKENADAFKANLVSGQFKQQTVEEEP